MTSQHDLESCLPEPRRVMRYFIELHLSHVTLLTQSMSVARLLRTAAFEHLLAAIAKRLKPRGKTRTWHMEEALQGITCGEKEKGHAEFSSPCLTALLRTLYLRVDVNV